MSGGSTSFSNFDLKTSKLEKAFEAQIIDYTILQHFEIDGFLVIKIKYNGVDRLEGIKIMLFEKCTLTQLLKQVEIDPHFSDNKEKISPIARFEPTERGWEMAIISANLLAHKLMVMDIIK